MFVPVVMGEGQSVTSVVQGSLTGLSVSKGVSERDGILSLFKVRCLGSEGDVSCKRAVGVDTYWHVKGVP